MSDFMNNSMTRPSRIDQEVRRYNPGWDFTPEEPQSKDDPWMVANAILLGVGCAIALLLIEFSILGKLW